MTEPFATASDHLVAESRVFALRVERLAALQRARGRAFDGRPTPGPAELQGWLRHEAATPAADSIERELAEAEALLAARLEEAGLPNSPLPGPRLVATYQLRPLEWSIVATLAVLELDSAARRAVTALAADPTEPALTVGLLSALLQPEAMPWEQEESLLMPDAPLVRHGLVLVGSGPSEDGLPEPPWCARPVKLAGSVALKLAGKVGVVDPLVAPYGRFGEAPRSLGGLLLSAELRAQTTQLLQLLVRGGGIVVLHGEPGVGRRTLAASIAGELGRQTLVLDLPTGAPGQQAILQSALRDAVVEGATLVVTVGSGDLPPGAMGILGATVELTGLPVFVVAAEPGLTRGYTGRVLELHVTRGDAALRERIWAEVLPPALRHAALDPAVLATRYELSFAEIHAAALRALSAARLRGTGRVHEEDLRVAAERSVTGRMGGLGVRVAAGFQWGDFVAEPDTVDLLKEVLTYARRADDVLENWGFGRKLPYGRGMLVLFSGPPGTGKTMAASIIASSLGRELYVVDLSRIVDKYIGETEKNLARVFDVAEQTDVVLLFDEADALFGSRSQAKSATDRYANLEVNYLLQRVEAYRGLIILTTNFASGIDKAFQRRIRFHVPFKEPDFAAREALWAACIPSECRVDPAVSWRALAERFPLNGAGIKNAVIRAAVRAADRDGILSTEDLVGAAVRECQQLGLAVRSDAPDTWRR